MHLARFLAPVALATSIATAAEPAPLFDGKSLDGWVNVNCAPDTWSARDGVIYCTGKPTGALRTEKQYENFVLELEWRHLKPGGNAGVFVWAGPISAPGVPFLRAVEVQVLDHAYGKSDWFTTHGDVFPIHGSKMDPFPPSKGMRSFPSEERSKGSPEWNHYKITCNDGTLTLAVNGKDVSGGKDCTYRKGYIALESEGSPVEFRNITLTELPSTGASPADTAPLAQGHLPLYTGVDLSGWKSADGRDDDWKSSDWRFVYRGENRGALESTEKFSNVEVIFDRKTPKPAGNGKWERVVETIAPGATARPISLEASVPGTEFASIYVRKLGS